MSSPIPSTKRKDVKRFLVPVVVMVVFVAGLIASYMLGQGRSVKTDVAKPAAEEKAAIWTCSMHPQVENPGPGSCPICGMDLIPRVGEPSGPRELRMSPAAMALAEIQVEPVKRKYVSKIIRMVGKVDYDETRMADITAWVSGRLDRLYVDYTGVTVREGDHLVSMYSPDLIVAQRELLQTYQAYQRLQPGQDRQLVETTLKTAERKLRLLGLKDEQVDQIKTRGAPSDHLTIYAPVGGVVITKHANEGVYVETGTKIYTIVDLTQVWIYLDAYESDVPWLRFGQAVEFTSESYPGEVFTGRIAFIDPVLSERTRTARVRVNVPNEDLKLKPGMFVRAIVRSQLAVGGRVFDSSLAGKWISPMHPEIIKDGPGQCDICGMDLVPAEELGLVAAEKAAQPPLIIPASAPLITGKRAVVYVRVPTSKDLFRQITTVYKVANAAAPNFDELVEGVEKAWQTAEKLKARRDRAVLPTSGDKVSNFAALHRVIQTLAEQVRKLDVPDFDALRELVNAAWKEAGQLTDWEEPSFEGRDIVLGHRAGEHYLVQHGLEEGEEVVISGNFKIDSALQLQRKPSMMSFAGGRELEVSDEFRRKLATVYTPYFKLQEALADDQLEDALAAWQSMREAVNLVPTETLDQQVGKTWQSIAHQLDEVLSADPPPDELEKLRKPFETIATAMLRTVATFGHSQPQPLQESFCPMAFKNKGAAWLQAEGKIANPYFGNKMLRCGEIRRKFVSTAEAKEDSP